MNNKNIFLGLALFGFTFLLQGRDTTAYKLRLSLPLLDMPQNISLPYRAPSMQQALDLSNDVYELGFWGIDALGDKLFLSKDKPATKSRKIKNTVFKYALSLGFSQYGSELPIPLGVWGHEEFHRSVLGVEKISSKNGNWLLNRWDGTVYGISDSTLSDIKQRNPDQLLYSYTAGIQYHTAINQMSTLNDFYKNRTLNKPALLLYNAFYVYRYFAFSTSAMSDSVKVLAPPNESKNPSERDYAGADLTAWVNDLFNPNEPYQARDSFPGGHGVNRRIGYSDLSSEEQSYLNKQKQLSLLNFINPAIFFINRIRLNKDLAFNFFAQYAPTHFGNSIAVYVPVQYKRFDVLLNIHHYSNKSSSGLGIGAGLFNYQLSPKWESDIALNIWNQPKSFYNNSKLTGGQISLAATYRFKPDFSGFVQVRGKTKGWMMANPYLKENMTVQLGVKYHIKKRP